MAGEVVNTRRRWSAVEIVALSCVIVALVFQLRLLYIFPQPDSARWWGDETGQILELRGEWETGLAHISAARGSSLEYSNGIIRSNSWAAAILYGLPALVFQHTFDPVAIGRTISALLSILLCFLLYYLISAEVHSRLWGLTGVAILVTSRVFFFGSHAARLDVAAGLAIVAVALYWMRWDQLHSLPDDFQRVRWFWIGIVYAFLSTLSIHLLTIGAAIVLYAIVHFRAFRIRPLLHLVTGIAITFAIILSIYYFAGGAPSLFTHSVQHNQFESVASELPILRPFSRSVQVANVLERLHGLWREAPFILCLAALSALAIILRPRITPKRSVTIGVAAATITAWLLLESPALYYYMQVLPILIAASVVILARRIPIRWKLSWPLLLLTIAVTLSAVRDTTIASTLATSMHRDNATAIREAVRLMATDSEHNPPIVLAENPAISQLAASNKVQLMTAHLFSFPTSTLPVTEQLQALHVRYLLTYAAPGIGADYSVETSPLANIGDTHGVVLQRWTGTLFDVGRHYFGAQALRVDTLTLYRLK